MHSNIKFKEKEEVSKKLKLRYNADTLDANNRLNPSSIYQSIKNEEKIENYWTKDPKRHLKLRNRWKFMTN